MNPSLQCTKQNDPDCGSSKCHSSSSSSQSDAESLKMHNISEKGPIDDSWIGVLEEQFASEMEIGSLPQETHLCAEAIISNAPYRIIETNTQFLVALGFKPKDVIQSLRVIKGPDTDDGRISRLIQKAFNGGISDESVVFYKKDGEELACIIRGQLIAHDGQPACKLSLLPYSFEDANPQGDIARSSSTLVGECILQNRWAASAPEPRGSANRSAEHLLEQYRICGACPSFRDLLGFRAEDSLQSLKLVCGPRTDMAGLFAAIHSAAPAPASGSGCRRVA
eukprot:CAMPEP_0172161688 /NCGR_PEP_ID=MMETSP1050-20130122/6261_1 /TAXON_ID=233186 /ORGANISM="Cryptomonas curvata, Strain CCAP979/52" /LENGTH=279 /DNA_ID=CAMNT_0012831607 /DNA_START=60 /DNA_END=896 /DNA_ORIENTATION=-